MQQLDVTPDVVARRCHLQVTEQVDGAADIACPYERLRPVVGDERVFPSTLFGSEHVKVGIEFTVAFVRAGLDEHEPSLHLVTFHTLQQHADLVSCDSFAEALAEHFEAHADGLFARLGSSANLDGVATPDLTLLHTAGHDRALTGDGQNIALALWGQEVGVARLQELLYGLDVCLGGAVQRLHCASLDDRSSVSIVSVLTEELPDLQLDQLQELRVFQHVELVQEHNKSWHSDLFGEQHVLFGLGHWPIYAGDDQDGAVHLCCARNHVLHVVCVAGAVHVPVVPVLGFVFYMRRVNGDSSLPLLWRAVYGFVRGVFSMAIHGAYLGKGGRERGFTVIDMSDGTNVEVFLVSDEGAHGEVTPSTGV
ncbi:ISxac3 transposase, putative [Babesia ovata]|uniref:ISxac3 transposase, putative n=1 Tax=Babesia ovata TaxID=189622 RepID=A0A2H6K9A4_9APIC|nr:ISxac3 transposase, putative [Babesia ovata]GBE59558.1 ISxac3 transposase, putative [Babesia ovata]